MNYFVCQEWSNTKGNHAGMVHLCMLIKEYYSFENKVIVIPVNKFLSYRGISRLINIYIFLVAIYLFFKTKKGDRIFLVEYFIKGRSQKIIANILRYRKVRLIGFAHLVPYILDQQFTARSLQKWMLSVDSIITLGSSLTRYFLDKGCSSQKIKTLFHYVDIDYYNNNNKREPKQRLSVLCMGSIARDYSMLRSIIEQCPEVDFHLCLGLNKKEPYFHSLHNVKIYHYLSEDALKCLMSESSVSLNVMRDTVGSNVITTSMAMGMVMIVSDVGSIRDYCNNQNAIFCTDINQFVDAITYLDKNRSILTSMGYSSFSLSSKMDVNSFYSKIQTV